MSNTIKKRLHLIDLTGAVTLAVAVAATICFGVVPLYARTNHAADETRKLNHELANLDGLSRTLAKVEAQLKSTESRLADTEARFPSSGAMDQFMSQVAKTAEQTGLEVIAITPKPLQDAGTFKIMPVEITGTGSYDTCYQFLTSLRRINRLTRLDDLVIQVDSNTPDHDHPDRKPVCKLVVGLSTFMAR